MRAHDPRHIAMHAMSSFVVSRSDVHVQIRNSLGEPIGPITIGRGKHSSVFFCSMGLLPVALKDLTAIEANVSQRALQPHAMIAAVSSVLHPNVAHTYGVLHVEGLCGVASSHAPGSPLSHLPLSRVHIQVRTGPSAALCFSIQPCH